MSKFCGALLFLLSVGLCAQTPDTAGLRGTVTGPDAIAITGSHVMIEDAQHHVLREILTGSDGAFNAGGLRAEPVYVRAEAPGLEAESGELTLAAGTTATVELVLHVPTAHARVVVTGAVGDVRTDEPQLGDRLAAPK